ncbi:MAG: phenylalanine--tRNA ligase subunit beta [Actinobacteria bacterium]|nr:phenylalanine--tRNA ligase subunit beta [Actinomycetota bacterium]
MRVSLQWLAEYVDLELDAREISQLLTASGTSVEAVEKVGGELRGILVGRVLEARPHPSAERLSLCRVDVGGEVREIVCGAPNVAAGILSPVALPGARLPDGTVIRETTIRGVASQGMLLSERELGISDDAQGIMVLEEGAREGMDLAEALAAEDTVLVLEITPNRPDCLCMLGIAREIAALTGARLRRPDFSLREEGVPAEEEVQVEILDDDLCSRYVARVIDGIRIGPSPWWLRKRLRAAGIRPINNVVDVTNYVMLELGQPLHAFDYHLVREGHIIVRRSRGGEVLTTLDGVERRLATDDLLICDPSGPVALAGVMGGENSEVRPQTVKVLLESAHFDPAGIMRTSRRHDISSEASYRFERGVDPGGCRLAADRAAFLMRELAGGEVSPGAVDAVARRIAPVRLRMRVERTARLIGISLDEEKALSILRSLELQATPAEEGVLEVEVPTFRRDLEREIDLVEEVARLYGYERIPSTMPRSASNVGRLTFAQRMRREMARALVGAGMHEAITVSFIPAWWPDLLDGERRYLPRETLRLRNPLSEEASVMRPSLLPGLLEALRFNLNRRVLDVHLFEMGRVFLPRAGEKLPHEPMRLACALTGKWTPKQWDREAEEVDFFTMKGVWELLAGALHLEGWALERKEFPFLHPSRSCAVVCGGEAGCMGVLHPRLAQRLDLPPQTVVMELEVDTLLRSVKDVPEYREIPRFPAVQMDLAVVVRDEVDSAEVERVIREAGGALLREVRLFDLYRGGQLREGEKSLAYNLVFQALDRTMRDEEAQGLWREIVRSLEERLGARLR